MNDQVRASFEETLNVTIKEWLEANAPASMDEAELEALMNVAVVGLLRASAGFSQSMPGPVRLSGHQFRKMAEAAFKEAARAPK